MKDTLVTWLLWFSLCVGFGLAWGDESMTEAVGIALVVSSTIAIFRKD